MPKEIAFRSIFISDLHLGTSDCQADMLAEFLTNTTSDNLYLVGDIVDLLKLQSSVYWPRTNNRIANLILDKAKGGTRVVYIPGNHDEVLRDFAGGNVNGIDIALEQVHTTAAGKRLLILHGDMFDDLVKHSRWLAHLGSGLYDLVLFLSRIYNRTRRMLGFSYWSFAAFIKYRLKEAVRYIEIYEETAARHASSRGFDGIVCGHIHHPNIRRLSDLTYFNTGDWVEHCTALVEDARGNIELIRWPMMRELAMREARTAKRAA